jgi:hypothetical protein
MLLGNRPHAAALLGGERAEPRRWGSNFVVGGGCATRLAGAIVVVRPSVDNSRRAAAAGASAGDLAVLQIPFAPERWLALRLRR